VQAAFLWEIDLEFFKQEQESSVRHARDRGDWLRMLYSFCIDRDKDICYSPVAV